MKDRLVAIAVAQHEIAFGDRAVPDDLVGRGGAADDEQRRVGAEDPRRVALALGDRPGVIEQRAEHADRYRDVGAKRVLAEELIEQVLDWTLAKSNAATVA